MTVALTRFFALSVRHLTRATWLVIILSNKRPNDLFNYWQIKDFAGQFGIFQ
jgi:hypothetical protein